MPTASSPVPNPADGDLDLNGFRARNSVASNLPTDAVIRGELESMIDAQGDARYLRLDGGNSPQATIPMGGQKFTGAAPATAASEFTRRDQVALLDGSQPFTAPQGGVAATAANHLVIKSQVDAALGPPRIPENVATYNTAGAHQWIVPDGVVAVYVGVGAGGGGGGGAKAIGIPVPSTSHYAGGKGASGGSALAKIVIPATGITVRAATTGNVDLAAPGATFDGVAGLAVDDLILVKAQTLPAANGVYQWKGATTPMVRAPAADTFAEFPMLVVAVTAGTAHAGQRWICAAVPGGTLGTTDLPWERLALYITIGAGGGGGGGFNTAGNASAGGGGGGGDSQIRLGWKRWAAAGGGGGGGAASNPSPTNMGGFGGVAGQAGSSTGGAAGASIAGVTGQGAGGQGASGDAGGATGPGGDGSAGGTWTNDALMPGLDWLGLGVVGLGGAAGTTTLVNSGNGQPGFAGAARLRW